MLYHLAVSTVTILSLMGIWILVQRWALRRSTGSSTGDGLVNRVGCGACLGGGCHCGGKPEENRPESKLRIVETGPNE